MPQLNRIYLHTILPNTSCVVTMSEHVPQLNRIYLHPNPQYFVCRDNVGNTQPATYHEQPPFGVQKS
jgi:hypothetical protein